MTLGLILGGVWVIAVGFGLMLTRHVQGRYAYNSWIRMGRPKMAHTPEYWANALWPGIIIVWCVGIAIVIGGLT